MKKTYNLTATTQKSYYGKAKVIENADGSHWLKSYDTIVCTIDKDGNFKKYWNGYSRTTMNHVNDFRLAFGFNPMNKKEWENTPCANGNNERYKVEFSNGFVTWIAEVTFDHENDAYNFAESVCEAKNWNLCYTVICDF